MTTQNTAEMVARVSTNSLLNSLYEQRIALWTASHPGPSTVASLAEVEREIARCCRELGI